MSSAAPLVLNEPYREAGYDPFENDMGENSLQRFISELLRPLLEDYLATLRGPTFVGADQYVGWDPDDAEKVLSPDVYILPGVEPGEDFEFWKVWQTGIVPSFALEIVSKREKKDYKTVPPLYGELGVDELILFDPRYQKRRGEVFRFQVYRKVAGRGFVRVETTLADRVRSQALGGWLRVVGEGKAQRLRLASDPSGDALVPTAREKTAAALAKAEKAAARAKTEKAAARADAEKASAALAEAVLTLHGVRFGAVPAEVATLVRRTRDHAVLLGWLRVVGAGSAVEVAAALVRDEAR
jgi:Uma2 family endonuclease